MFLYIVLALPVLFLIRRMMSKKVPSGPAPVVSIATGRVQGELCYSTAGRVFSSFYGIPYAKPPVGGLRFLKPEAPDRWEGIKKCVRNMTFIQLNAFRPGSPQEGREDGLVVNVSSPHLSPVRRLPVMVWIHGGGFVAGSGSRQMYGMEHFMDRDVVMVSFNYRLGLLGGLYLDRERVPGNQGLRDQVRALQWVRENIEHFGGDKERVTIFGESAGGMSVMNLVLSPAAKGLFSAAITMSGSPFSPFVGLDKHPRHYSNALIRRLGGDPAGSLEDILQLLQSKDAVELQRLIDMFEEFIRYPMPFKPIVDKDLVDDPLIPDEPLTLIKEGRYNKVPIMIGSNKNEGLLVKGFYARNLSKYDEAFDNWKTVGPLATFHREKDEVSTEESEICRDFRDKLFAGTRFGHTGRESELLVRMYGDIMFTFPADLLSKLLASQPDSLPLYQYIYNHQGYISLYDIISKSIWEVRLKAIVMLLGLPWARSSDGVCHGDELFMMFKGTLLPDIARTETDRRVRRDLVDMWVDFATHHDPTPVSGTWTRFDPQAPKYLDIGSEGNTMMYPDSHKERMEEWRQINEKVPANMRHLKSKTWNEY